MAIWDFSNYEDEDLDRILKHMTALEELGIQQDEDMMIELRAAINERKKEDE